MKKLILIFLLIVACESGEIIDSEPGAYFEIIEWQQAFIDIDKDGFDDGFYLNINYKVTNLSTVFYNYCKIWFGIVYENDITDIVTTNQCKTYEEDIFNEMYFIENMFWNIKEVKIYNTIIE